MSKKNDRDYWYDYLDINYLLKAKSQGNMYEVIDSTGTDDLQALQRVNGAFTVLNNPNSLNVVAIPINLGISNQGIWQGSHWVGLVIKKIGSTFKAFYTNSLGSPMETSFTTSDGATFCTLKQILINHGVTENNIIESNVNLPAQQSNGYDCGPWTVFNLDSLAKTEDLPNVSDHEIVAQRNSLLSDPLEFLLEEQSDKACEAIKNEPIHSDSNNSANVLSDSKLSKDLASLTEEDKEISELIKGTKHLSLVPPPKTKFVINTIAYVPERKFRNDSSSEERDGSFSDADFNFDLKNKSSFPFTTTPPKYTRKKEINFEELSNSNQSDSISRIITPFLEKLSQNSFEKDDKDKLTTSISTSIALNRMKSLSTRKNKSLDLELKSKIETDIRYEKFGFFWKCEWYSKRGTAVDQNLVRKFYKQLKKLDPKKAQEFRETEEKNIDVPYQKLREYAKNHDKTKKLVQEFRKKDHDANIYLSLIDSDTVNFNGIYSAYLRIVKDYNIPTVMSTGYEYSKDEPAYQFASHIDRMIRVITALHIPLGVYYPEPNTCVLIQQRCDTLLESFIDKTRPKGNLESACLVKKIQNRKNATFIFSKDKPLITTIPDRAKLNKASKSPISFSFEFVQGASPTKDDIKSCKQVTQSHFHEKVWYDNLFINGAIVVDAKVNKNALKHCKSLLSKIRNPKEANDKNEAINELKQYINSDVVDTIVKATETVKKHIKQFKIDYIRSEDEKKLLRILEECKIEITKFSRDKLLMLAQQPVLELVEKEIINLQDLIGLDIEVLEYICYDEEIIEMVKNETINFDNLLYLLKENFSNFMQAREEYSILEILEEYAENPLHLTFMAGDPTDIVLENSDNEEIVKFGIENYDIDTAWVRGELNAGREHQDSYSAALMDFDRIIMGIDEDFSHSDNETYYEEILELEEVSSIGNMPHYE
ncbi:Ulp1 family isopeptidase [Candidatus Tisiphia endosymbiont of Micropterix aruncella]|uniref:Ulp1 family isopeptidase n=1 Tax=Candidatus Tisiphia endosymbiont of Micropterix aruncella TaxID=3066271 RepID=UPI003AA8E6D3